MATTLAVIDADRIHDYVFSPRRLKLVRGASAVQSVLNLEDLPRALPAGSEQIYAGGGTLLAEFQNRSTAETFCREAATMFRHRTGIATMSHAVLENSDQRGFLEQWRELRRLLEAKKTGFPGRRSSAHTNPYWKRCEACGLFPAEGAENDDGDEEPLCNACQKRQQHSGESRYFTVLRNRFGLPRQVRPPKDFEELGRQSTPEGYLALIYLDGDRLGRFLGENVKSKEDFRTWSGRIKEGVQTAVLTAAATLCQKDAPIAPFEILLLGGDDALIAVSAHRALDFLSNFDQMFQKEFGETSLTYSAGVLFAHSHYPIADGIAEAEALLRSAKSVSGGRVDFRVLTGSAPDRQANETAGPPKHTMRPYTLKTLFELRDRISIWKSKGMPRNKVRELYRLAYEEKDQANFEYSYLLSRLSGPHREEFERAFPGATLWNSDNRTVAADIVELWEFVK